MSEPRKPLVSWGALIAIIVIFIVAAAIILPALARAREAARRSSCQNNLKQWALVFKMYANEVKGEMYPPISAIKDNWTPDMNCIYPEYLTDPSILVCPNSPLTRERFFLKHTLDHPRAEMEQIHPDCVSGLFYNYTGYAIWSDEQASAIYQASLDMPWDMFRDAELEIEVPVWEGSPERMPVGQNTLPIMWDRIPPTTGEFNHIPQGCNVLHLDGHVEFVRYAHYNASNNFPATRMAALAFGSGLPQLNRDCYETSAP